LIKIGFTPRILKGEGRPSFDTKVFLKIYLYGYLNGIRSSRRLEKECLRNLEMQWLLEAIAPNYMQLRKTTNAIKKTHNCILNDKRLTNIYLEQSNQNGVTTIPI
jgi:transposase